MKLRVLLCPLFASLGLGFFAAACSAEDPDDNSGTGGTGGGSTAGSAYCRPADTCPVDASTADLVTPVSFATDVFPIFQATCSGIVCHGVQGASSAGLWLGPKTGTLSTELANTIIESLKVPSKTAPAMNNVTPGNWQNSFTMLKIDGCQDSVGLVCEPQDPRDCFDNPCGAGMPQLDDPESGEVYPLTVDQRNKIRAWIAQGAQNN